MKTIKNYIFALLTVLLSVMSLSAKGIEICEHPDTYPAFPGGIMDGIPKYLRDNFKYPKEAYKQQKETSMVVRFTITKDGKLRDFEMPAGGYHPALEKELARVFEGTTWYPATKNGRPVNVRYTLYIKLHPRNGGDYEKIPYGLEYIAKDANNSISGIGKTLPPANELATIKKTIGEAAEIFNECPRYPIAYATLGSTLGEKENALTAMDSCWVRYRWIPNPESGRIGPTGAPMRIYGYNGRTEIWVALMRAMQHQFHSSEMTDSAYSEAMTLINDRILDNDLREAASFKEAERAQRRAERMQRDMVNEFIRKDVVGMNTPGWEKITREYSLDNISGALAYWNKQGLVNNAQVEQLSNLISQEWDAMIWGKNATSKIQLNLFGSKAFAIWMHEGDEGLDRFIAQIRDSKPSKKLLKYLSRLEKRKAANAVLLSDRKAVLQSLACMVPPEGTDAAGVQAFYDRRKAVEDVFPIKWLSK